VSGSRLAAQPDLESTLEEIAWKWADRVSVRLPGPLAPYDFVATNAGE
jgi:hypothetical protein